MNPAVRYLRAALVVGCTQPGGNVTGMTLAMPELDRKRLEVLKDAVPGASRIAHLFSAGFFPEATLRSVDDSARLLGVRLQPVAVASPDHLETTFSTMATQRIQAVLVQDSVMFVPNVDRITALALKHRLPALSQIPRFAESGGLVQYGASNLDLVRRSAIHVDKILKGAEPGDLPIEQPVKVELFVNLKTVRALGLTIPRAILIRADRVIE